MKRTKTREIIIEIETIRVTKRVRHRKDQPNLIKMCRLKLAVAPTPLPKTADVWNTFSTNFFEEDGSRFDSL
ncbi:MAG: hypothetical protein ABJA66_06820 [Actinomycetota bacterium]